MPRRPQEDPNPPDVWLIGLKLVLAASATALISDAPTPVVATVTLGALLVFAVVSSARRRNHSLATALAVLAGHRLAVALSVTTVLLLICAAYLVGVRKERDANSNLAGRVLLRVVSPELRPSCSPLDDSAAVAAIDCTDRGAGVGIRFLQFASSEAMNAALDQLVAISSAPPGGCFTQAIAIGSYSLHGEEAGRLWCDALDERQRLAWTNAELLILAKAEQTSSVSNSLMQWWSETGTALSTDGLRRPFPDEYERRLLEHVPKAFRGSCKRDGFSLTGSRATVQCLPRRGADNAYYLLFEDRSQLDHHVGERRKEVGHWEGTCSAGRHEPVVSPYRDGTRICYDEGNVSWVEWSDDDLLIYALARQEPQDLFRLYGWWMHNAGPS